MGGGGSKVAEDLLPYSESEQAVLAARLGPEHLPMRPNQLAEHCHVPVDLGARIVAVFDKTHGGTALSRADVLRVVRTLHKTDCSEGGPEVFGLFCAAGGNATPQSFRTTLALIVQPFTRAHIALCDGEQEAEFVTAQQRSAFAANADSLDHSGFVKWAHGPGRCVLKFLQAQMGGLCHSEPPKPAVPELVILSEPRLLQLHTAWLLSAHMVDTASQRWSQLFNSKANGQSLNQLFARSTMKGPFLVLVHTEGGEVFGGYCAEGLRKHSEFYGGASSFLFSLSPHLGIFLPSGFNDNFFYFNLNTQTLPNGLGMGGQLKHFGFWIDSNCTDGHSEGTVTFESTALTQPREFRVAQVEVWGCDLSQAVVSDPDKRGALNANEDKFMMDLVGRTGHSNHVAPNDHPDPPDESAAQHEHP